MFSMAVLKSTACKSSYGRLTYVFNQVAHNDTKTVHRVLACSGNNINMLHAPNGMISTTQSGAYLEKQFHQCLKRAFNPHRQYQAQSIVISFAESEFDTSDLKQQAAQALQLVQGFVHKYFGDAQSVVCIQCDGDGGQLHAHLLINTVKRNGKTVPTSRFSVYRMRKQLNTYLKSNFQKVTSRQWHNPFTEHVQRQDLNQLPTHSEWEQYLCKTIDELKQRVNTTDAFLRELAQKGIHVRKRGKSKRWTYTQIIVGRQGKPKLMQVRDFYQRKDKTGHVLSTRGLGQAYTQQGLQEYWNKQKEKEPVAAPTPHYHQRKEVNNDESVIQPGYKERIKNRESTETAQATIRRQQLNLRQQQSAEDQEGQFDVKQQSGSTTKNQSDQKRFDNVSTQGRSSKSSEYDHGYQAGTTKDAERGDFGPNL